jgi:NADH-quinone oxidoreductase subunit I
MRLYGTGLIKSMQIAFRNFMRPPITVQYPHEKVMLPERSRWALAMTYDENGEHKCTGCIACERACPDFIIKIDLTTAEDRSKHIDHWGYEIGACMMCGLCVEACPYDAIHMSHEYELARTDPTALRIELLTDTPAVSPKRRTAEPAAGPAAEPAAAEPAPAEPAAEPAAGPAAEPNGGGDV